MCLPLTQAEAEAELAALEPMLLVARGAMVEPELAHPLLVALWVELVVAVEALLLLLVAHRMAVAQGPVALGMQVSLVPAAAAGEA